jgi:D-sedoheptulose 7-phosphate isomerase
VQQVARDTPEEIQQVHPQVSSYPRPQEMTHTEQFLKETQEIASLIPAEQVERLVSELKSLRDRGGRLFLVGLGGSAANCSHAVSDFRRLCGIDALTPVDNFAEFTAGANDEGWANAFSAMGWTSDDDVMVLSVGGGTDKVSVPITSILGIAAMRGMTILGIVGRDGGYTKQVGGGVIVIPTINPKHVTPHTEAWQMVLLHCIVSHPDLQIRPTKW